MLHIATLLDENVEFGKEFVELTLELLETCVFADSDEDILAKCSLAWLREEIKFAWIDALGVICAKVHCKANFLSCPRKFKSNFTKF